MRRFSPASILATAAGGLLLAGCSTDSTPTSLKQIDPVARFATGPSATSAPEPGTIKICKAAESNVSGTFTVSSVSANGGSATVLSPTTVAPGSCTIVAEDLDGAEVGSYNTPAETSAGFVSVTAKFVSRSADGVTTTSDIPYTPGQALFLNQFHGYTLTYVNHVDAPPPRVVALFVIGDVEAHAIGNVVNFWGAQWWKNNFMSGFVSNGVASFKGYASESDNVCGGTWTSRPGNSSNPPDVIPAVVRIIVTSKVVKDGPNISGDIKQLVDVTSDGGYGPAPGKRGNGPVTTVVCDGAVIQ